MIQVQDIDGNVYNTVWIGKQLWLAENLKVTKFRNGDPISRFYNGNYYNVATETPYYIPSSATGYDGYGHYYNIFGVNDLRNIAPRGCRIPTYNDITELGDYLQPNLDGSRLASERIALTHPHPRWQANIAATNEFGFSLLPSGFLFLTGLGGDPYSGYGIINRIEITPAFTSGFISIKDSSSLFSPFGIRYINPIYELGYFTAGQDNYHIAPKSYASFAPIRCLVDTNKINMLLWKNTTSQFGEVL